MNDRLRAVPDEPARREATAPNVFPRPWQRAVWLLILGVFAVAAFLRACGVEF